MQEQKKVLSVTLMRPDVCDAPSYRIQLSESMGQTQEQGGMTLG
jgi:hypothetical protein